MPQHCMQNRSAMLLLIVPETVPIRVAPLSGCSVLVF